MRFSRLVVSDMFVVNSRCAQMTENLLRISIGCYRTIS